MDKRKILIKTLFGVIVFSVLLLGVNFCLAAGLGDAFIDKGPLGNVAGSSGAGYQTTGVSVESMVGQAITVALSFVGVIFLGLMVYGGYIWMVARGNEQEVEKAKNIIKNSIIGIVIVLGAYVISYYVISAIGDKSLNTKKTNSSATITI